MKIQKQPGHPPDATDEFLAELATIPWKSLDEVHAAMSQHFIDVRDHKISQKASKETNRLFDLAFALSAKYGSYLKRGGAPIDACEAFVHGRRSLLAMKLKRVPAGA